MFLDFTDEQIELRDSARATLERECPRAGLGRAPDPARDEALATALTWVGWPALTIPVDLGGLGRSFVELAIIIEEMGRAAAPGAFLSTTTQFLPVVREVGTTAQAHRFLAGVASGDTTGALALHEGGRWDPETVVATAERDGDGWLLQGHKQHVLGAPEVDEVVVAARRDSGTLGLFVVPAAELGFKRTASLDVTRPLANLELNGVWVPDARALGEPEADARRPLGRALAEATVGLALDALGACGAIVATSLDAALTRERAGQATEHALADMVVALETARASTYQAVCAVAEQDASMTRAASAAKVAVGECQRAVTRQSLEIHGTPPPPELPVWIGRVQADDLLLGAPTDHRRIVADHALSSRRARSSQLVAELLA